MFEAQRQRVYFCFSDERYEKIRNLGKHSNKNINTSLSQ